jgi:lipoprotein-anchoring transpeptidase ErfK/SrfK
MASHRVTRRSLVLRWLPTVFVVLAVIGGGFALSRFHGPRPHLATPSTTVSPAAQFNQAPPASPTVAHAPATHARTSAAPPPPKPPSPCRTNTDAQRVIVSIAKQHAWVCAGPRQLKDTPVTSGATATGDGTPVGTYHLQAKETDRMLTVLSGESFHVDYWMPYDGVYGFHDASWQKFPYGSSQYRTDGSHGCVHFPHAVMAWLYNWADVGATVTIQS